MSNVVVIDEAVADLLTKLKSSSVGLPQSECDATSVATLEKLGLVRVQPAENGRPARVKPMNEAWTTEVRV